MHTFFHGWRRMAGCVTLVMALVVMVRWVRSLTMVESWMWLSSERNHTLYIADGTISWWTWEQSESGSHTGIMELVFQYVNEIHIPWWIPTWSLTLLSAYLIFWNPRKRA